MRFASQKFKTNIFVKILGITKIPLMFFCRPKVMHIDSDSVIIKIPFKRRTKNHVGSMYLGALSVGADLSGGLLALEHIRKSNQKISLLFKDFHADFLKRAEGDVHFKCNQGSEIIQLVEKAIRSNERENMIVDIDAFVPSISNDIVAKFQLTLSLKEK